MPILELTIEQVYTLVKQIPPEQKRWVLLMLAEEACAQREERLDYAEVQLRRLCAERGRERFCVWYYSRIYQNTCR